MSQMREFFTKCGKKIKDFFAKMTVEVDEKEDKEGWSLGDFVATILRTMKLLWDVLLVFALGGLLFGAGIAIGYAASLFNETETPDPANWFNKCEIFPAFQRFPTQMEASFLILTVT